MGGFDDHVAIIGDWLPPSPSPRSFFSAILGDDIIGTRSVSEVSEPKADENKNGFSFPGHEGQIGSENTEEKTVGAIDQASSKQGAFSEQKMNSRSGLVERIAARAGFNAPRLNTEIIRPADISQNPEMRSPYLTIPPGLSPTTLLDSPVFLSNSLVQPSPTTGKFQFAPNGNGKSSMMVSDASDTSQDNLFENINTSSFAFKPVPESTSFSRGAMNQVPPSFPVRQSFPSIDVSVPSESSFPTRNTEPSKIHSQNGMNALHYQANVSVASFERNVTEGNNNFSSEQNRPFGISASSAVEQSQAQQNEPQDEDGDQRDANINNAPSEDGYNWRKYGQKQVKGSEYPRSYYKCTHPNCHVKKKVERSHEGYITEIIYKGAHNHPKPPPAHKSGMGSSNALSDTQGDMIDQDGPSANGSDPVWGKGNADWSSLDNLDVTSSALQGQNGATHFESSDVVDGSSTFSNEEEEEEEDRATHGSVSLGYDGEGDESESKRRKVEAYAADVSGATRAIREPRVVVQTTSDVDILDDGYRWRKYGQKVVKGNPNPRSYYKCTNAGCTVRKHVERASHDLKSVITTYEGKHNHDVPAARNSSHVNSNTMPQQAVQSQMYRSDPSQLHNGMVRFDRGHTLGSFGPPGPGRQQLGYGFGMNQPGLANLAMAGLGQNQGKMPVLPVHQYLAQPCQMNDMGFMLPKGEPKVEPVTDPGLNISSGSSVYHQIMSRLGPQM